MYNKLKPLLLAAILAAAGLTSAAGTATPTPTADPSLGAQLSSGLAAVRPLDADFRRRVLQQGETLDRLTADRLGSDVQGYATQRIAALRASRQPEAQWAAGRLAQCEDDTDCITNFAVREALGQSVQAAHTGVDYNVYNSLMVHLIETSLERVSPAGPAPAAAERQLELVQQYYSMPLTPLLERFGRIVAALK